MNDDKIIIDWRKQSNLLQQLKRVETFKQNAKTKQERELEEARITGLIEACEILTDFRLIPAKIKNSTSYELIINDFTGGAQNV